MMPSTVFVMSPFHYPHSLADLHVKHGPHPTAAAVVIRLFAFAPRVDQPQRTLLADPEWHAVGLEREDPIRAVDILRHEVTGEPVDRNKGDLHLRRLHAAEHLAEQRTLERCRRPEFGRRRRDRSLFEPEQHGAIERKGLLE